MAFSLVPFSELKHLLGLEKEGIGSYPDLEVLVSSVTAAIESYCGRSFEPVERTETRRIGSIGTRFFDLQALPIDSVSAVTKDGEAVDASLYYIGPGGIEFTSAMNRAQVSVTYTGGLSATPDSIKRAALMQISYEYQGKENIGASSVSTDGGTVSRPELGLLKEVKRLLADYIHPGRY